MVLFTWSWWSLPPLSSASTWYTHSEPTMSASPPGCMILEGRHLSFRILVSPTFTPGTQWMLTKGLACTVWCFPDPCLFSWSTSYVEGPPLLVLKSKMTYVMLGLVARLCSTLCDPIDCSLPGSSVHGDSLGKNTVVAGHAFLQGIFPSKGSNPGLLDYRRILYHLSHQGSLMY